MSAEHYLRAEELLLRRDLADRRQALELLLALERLPSPPLLRGLVPALETVPSWEPRWAPTEWPLWCATPLAGKKRTRGSTSWRTRSTNRWSIRRNRTSLSMRSCQTRNRSSRGKSRPS